MCFYKRLWNKYDKSFLFNYGVQYANASAKLLIMLAVSDLFKNYMMLEPAQNQLLTTIM